MIALSVVTIPLFKVDAFTGVPFRGNPAAVCLTDGPRDPRWMQDVAREMNLAETAFVSPKPATNPATHEDGFDLRWFTPTVEVDLCGHATLASAHVLWESGRLAPGAIARFHTKSGVLTASQEGSWITLDFPSTPAEPAPVPAGLAGAVGANLRYVGRSRFDYLLELDNEDVVRSLRPDLQALVKLPVRGVIVTSRATTPGVDFVSRFFGPASGIDEDPVTGSAHCALAPYWSPRLGKHAFVAHQVSARGGVLRVTLAGDRVRLAGQAVTIVRGELLH